MKKLKHKYLFVTFITAFFTILLSFSSFAYPQYKTGLIWDDWESYLEDMDDDLVKILSCLRPGDVNGDGIISAADARIVLRASIGLEQLSENQKVSADVDKSLSITASDARFIFRVSVDLEKTNELVITESKEMGFVIGSLETAGSGKYTWKCVDSKNGFNVREYFINTEPEKEGAPVKQYFIFTPENAGSFNLKFILSDSNKNEVLEEFEVKAVINENSVE